MVMNVGYVATIFIIKACQLSWCLFCLCLTCRLEYALVEQKVPLFDS